MTFGPFPVSHWGGIEEPPEDDGLTGPGDGVHEAVNVEDFGIIDVLGPVEKLGVEFVSISETIERDRVIEVSEEVVLADIGQVDIFPVVEKLGLENVSVNESIEIDRIIEISESLDVVDEGILNIIEALEKLGVETVSISELIELVKGQILVSETVSLEDFGSIEAQSRNVEKLAVEDVEVSESIEVDITVLDPVVLNQQAHEDGTTAWCTFDAGDYCESVDVDYQLNNDGVWRNHYTEDTTPNTSGYTSPDVGEASSGDVVEFRLIPYTGDQQGGSAGTAKFTNEVTVGGGGGA